MFKKITLFVTMFVLVSISVSTFALGYIDPSSVTFLIQIIAGAAATIVAGAAVFWKKLKADANKKQQDKEEAARKANPEKPADESISYASKSDDDLPMAD